ncbi:MAG: thioredoxin-like domain-containing protein [Parvularculaceae bacterium]
MIGALIASQILLLVLVAGLAFMCFALARQIGVLHERIAPAGALAVNQRLRVGDPAPAMAVETIDGARVDIGGAAAESTLLFFTSPECPVCKALSPILRRVAEAERAWVKVVIASDGGDPARHRSYISEQKFERLPYVLSEPLGRAFSVAKLPYAVLIDEQGRIASMGIVNSREHLESLFEAKERGVASLQDYAARRAHDHQQRAAG